MRIIRWIIPSAGRLAIVGGALLIALMAYPVRNEITRVGIIVSAVVADGALLYALRRRRKVLLLVAVPQLILALFLVMPGRDHDPAALRRAYVSALKRFEGTRYVWGGENHLGVDCSGLLRASLVEAHLVEGVRTVNPRLMRQAIWFWWNDASANEMSLGYSGRTVAAGRKGLLADVEDEIAAGDFAVTADGSHVLAFLGDREWIEADPFKMEVIRIKDGDTSQWWHTKVVPRRWKMLQESGG